MVDYSWPRVQYEKNHKKTIFLNFFGIFLSIQGVQGAIQEGPEPIPELKNIKKINIFNFSKNYNFPPRHHKIIIIIFRRAIATIIMAAVRQKDEF